MAIMPECPGCGKRLKVKDEPAGKRGKCPGCGALLTIPEPAAGGAQEFPDEFDLEETGDKAATASAMPKPPAPCPNCGQPVPSSAVFCVKCGTDVRSGTRVEEAKESLLGNLRSNYWGLLFVCQWAWFALLFLPLVAIPLLSGAGAEGSAGATEMGLAGQIIFPGIAVVVSALYPAAIHCTFFYHLTYPPQSCLGWIFLLGPDLKSTAIKWVCALLLLPFFIGGLGVGAVIVLWGVVLFGDLWSWLVFKRLYIGEERRSACWRFSCSAGANTDTPGGPVTGSPCPRSGALSQVSELPRRHRRASVRDQPVISEDKAVDGIIWSR